ncbi:hypothetical protein CYMTET_18710 [Cymbomonas tetramitiformis]|uniref:Uncharacterized protein n=1 Tax=Cymbomonas tetramitiformis TaxID=36881 RepID=A0AAE0G7I4_9CHLO|nr:hypothetical protein CYMTET_18710 [Cymbomonas tetramitiformis]
MCQYIRNLNGLACSGLSDDLMRREQRNIYTRLLCWQLLRHAQGALLRDAWSVVKQSTKALVLLGTRNFEVTRVASTNVTDNMYMAMKTLTQFAMASFCLRIAAGDDPRDPCQASCTLASGECGIRHVGTK